MRTHSRISKIVLTLALVSSLTSATNAGAATQADVFNPYCVSRVDITAPQTSLDALVADPKGAYQPGTMVANICGAEELPVKNITFRLKGSGSFQPLSGKAAFKIKMSSANRIEGLKSLTLNNLTQDESMIREALAYKAFRAVGVTGPRSGYAIVSIRNSDTDVVTDYGLHANIESFDDRFLNDNYGAGTWGHLYEGPDWQVYGVNRDILPAHVPNFETEETASGALATDLVELANISTIAGNSEWWAAFQQKFDATKVLRLFATERYIGDWDGYGDTANNYYLHSTLAGVFDLIPSGKDSTFVIKSSLDPSSAGGQVLNRCLNVPDCRAAFRSARNFVAETIIGLDLVDEAHRVATTIAPAVLADTRMAHTAEFQCEAANDAVEFLVDRETLWRTSYRVPGSGITSAQTSAPIECDEDGISDPWTGPPVDPTPPTGPVGPTPPTGLPPVVPPVATKPSAKFFKDRVKAGKKIAVSLTAVTPGDKLKISWEQGTKTIHRTAASSSGASVTFRAPKTTGRYKVVITLGSATLFSGSVRVSR